MPETLGYMDLHYDMALIIIHMCVFAQVQETRLPGPTLPQRTQDEAHRR
jgi:hypothetical protein